MRRLRTIQDVAAIEYDLNKSNFHFNCIAHVIIFMDYNPYILFLQYNFTL